MDLNTSLKKLILFDNPINVEGFESIMKFFENTKIQNLNFSKCIKKEMKIKNLELSLENSSIMKNLLVLDLSSNNLNSSDGLFIRGILDNFLMLEKLILANNMLEIEGLKIIADSLESNKSLKFLDISNNMKCGDEGCSVLKNCLKANTNLIYIDLSGNNIQDKGKLKYFA